MDPPYKWFRENGVWMKWQPGSNGTWIFVFNNRADAWHYFHYTTKGMKIRGKGWPKIYQVLSDGAEGYVMKITEF